MADILEILVPILMWVGIIVLIITPWILFIIFSLLNKNFWLEFLAIFDKHSIRVIDFLHNGAVNQYFKKMNKDKRIEIQKSGKGDPTQDEILTPTNPPNFEAGGRKVFCRIQGTDNNFNPVSGNSIVTEPVRQMYGSMRFEDGRRYERRMFAEAKDPNLKIYILFIILIGALLLVVGMQYAGNSMLQQLVDAGKNVAKAAADAATGA